MVPLKKWNFLDSLADVGTEEGLHCMQLQLLLLFPYYYRRCDVTKNCTTHSSEQTIHSVSVSSHTLPVSVHYSNYHYVTSTTIIQGNKTKIIPTTVGN